MNFDFELLRNSIGKQLKFEANYMMKDKSLFKDIFYGYLREVKNDLIVVEQYFVEEENGEEKIKSIKRNLKKNAFIISTEIPLNH